MNSKKLLTMLSATLLLTASVSAASLNERYLGLNIGMGSNDFLKDSQTELNADFNLPINMVQNLDVLSNISSSYYDGKIKNTQNDLESTNIQVGADAVYSFNQMSANWTPYVLGGLAYQTFSSETTIAGVKTDSDADQIIWNFGFGTEYNWNEKIQSTASFTHTIYSIDNTKATGELSLDTEYSLSANYDLGLNLAQTFAANDDEDTFIVSIFGSYNF